MKLRLFAKGSLSYGVSTLRGKAVGLFLLAATPGMAADRTLVAFGDSLTQGYGLIEQEGFVPQLRDWLAGQGVAVQVVNAGVSGDTTAGGAARVAWTLTPDVDAMIVALGGNDLLRGLPPEVSRRNIETILQSAQAAGVQVLLVGMDAPGNYGPEYKAAFDALYPDLAETYGALFFDNFFKGLTEDGSQPADLVAFFQADGIHPNGEGVKRIVAAMGPAVLELLDTAK